MNNDIIKPKPILFIGSSTNGLHVARELKGYLDKRAEVMVWKDAFPLGYTTISTLMQELNHSNYAVLIATPDDIKLTGVTRTNIPRDNVIFETGLFMGKLGARRTFILCEKNSELDLPSDWAGLTILYYNLSAEDNDPLQQPANKIISLINVLDLEAAEVDFLQSYLTFIPPDIKIWDSYADILTHHYNKIKSELDRLQKDNDWSGILEIKKRIREYFEYSGQYKKGVDFGKAYRTALNELGRCDEAAWSSIKDIGYMLILDNQHSEGRNEIKNVLTSIGNNYWRDENQLRSQLRFYALRYMGISFQRDELTGDLRRAKIYFEKAQEQLNAFSPDDRLYKEMYARLLRNFGNLSLAEGKFENALLHYKESLKIFEDLDDTEHIGYTHLGIAEAIITMGNRNISDANSHLRVAENIFTRIGCIEGHGRVLEQFSLYHLKDANQTTSMRKRSILEEAKSKATTAKNLFERIGSHRLSGRIDRIIHDIRRMIETHGDVNYTGNRLNTPS